MYAGDGTDGDSTAGGGASSRIQHAFYGQLFVSPSGHCCQHDLTLIEMFDALVPLEVFDDSRKLPCTGKVSGDGLFSP